MYVDEIDLWKRVNLVDFIGIPQFIGFHIYFNQILQVFDTLQCFDFIILKIEMCYMWEIAKPMETLQ